MAQIESNIDGNPEPSAASTWNTAASALPHTVSAEVFSDDRTQIWRELHLLRVVLGGPRKVLFERRTTIPGFLPESAIGSIAIPLCIATVPTIYPVMTSRRT